MGGLFNIIFSLAASVLFFLIGITAPAWFAVGWALISAAFWGFVWARARQAAILRLRGTLRFDNRIDPDSKEGQALLKSQPISITKNDIEAIPGIVGILAIPITLISIALLGWAIISFFL